LRSSGAARARVRFVEVAAHGLTLFCVAALAYYPALAE
jgi:hypothetical protein